LTLSYQKTLIHFIEDCIFVFNLFNIFNGLPNLIFDLAKTLKASDGFLVKRMVRDPGHPP